MKTPKMQMGKLKNTQNKQKEQPLKGPVLSVVPMPTCFAPFHLQTGS